MRLDDRARDRQAESGSFPGPRRISTIGARRRAPRCPAAGRDRRRARRAGCVRPSCERDDYRRSSMSKRVVEKDPNRTPERFRVARDSAEPCAVMRTSCVSSGSVRASRKRRASSVATARRSTGRRSTPHQRRPARGPASRRRAGSCARPRSPDRAIAADVDALRRLSRRNSAAFVRMVDRGVRSSCDASATNAAAPRARRQARLARSAAARASR